MAKEFIFPLSKYLTITQGFHSSHLGNDYGWNSSVTGGDGQAIIASEAGTVKETADGYGNTYKDGKGQRIYGNYIIIDHGSNYFTVYGHLKKGLLVKKGQKVSKGQPIAYMGNSGFSNGQHLHFEIRVGGITRTKYAKDPLNYVAIENEGLIVSGKTLFPDKIKRRKTTVGTPVPRDENRDQIEIITPTLNARTSPTTKADRLGYVTMGLYNLLSEKTADGYTWAEIEPGIFCAEKDTKWTIKYPKPKDPDQYDVTFKSVSEGEKTYLEEVAKTLGLKVSVKKIN